MKFTLAAAVALAVSSVSAFTINTPTNVVQCQPIQFTWDATGATPPFFLSVHPGTNPTAPALFEWDGLTGASFTWNPVVVAGGTSLSLLLRDSSGNSVQSAPFVVQTSTTTACLNGTSTTTTSGTSVTLGTTTTTPGTVTTPGTTTPETTTPHSTSTSHSGSTSPSGTSTGTSGAIDNVARIGFAGVVAAVIAAVIA